MRHNQCLHVRHIGCAKLTRQPTDSAGLLAAPGSVFILGRSLSGALQASFIWGAMLQKKLRSWVITPFARERRLYFNIQDGRLLLVCIAVYSIAFESNDVSTMEELITEMTGIFEVKIYENLTSS